MISLVTASMASGIRAATDLATRLATTTLGADFHTIRMIAGVLLRSALSRSRHLGLGSLLPWPIAVSTEFMICNFQANYEGRFYLAKRPQTYVTGGHHGVGSKTKLRKMPFREARLVHFSRSAGAGRVAGFCFSFLCRMHRS